MDRLERRDPRQVPLREFVSPRSLRWVVRHRAWSRYYLVRYWRFLVLRVRHPDVVTEGFVLLGRRVRIEVRPGYGRMVLGRWVHIGDDNRLRAHEGTLRLGDKVVLGRDSTINCYLDVEIGPRVLVADWVYICDFDHRYDDPNRPMKDQGLVKAPVRIGADVWVGVKATVLRGSVIGEGSVLAAHTVVRGIVPPRSLVAGVPGVVVRRRTGAATTVGSGPGVVVPRGPGEGQGEPGHDEAGEARRLPADRREHRQARDQQGGVTDHRAP